MGVPTNAIFEDIPQSGIEQVNNSDRPATDSLDAYVDWLNTFVTAQKAVRGGALTLSEEDVQMLNAATNAVGMSVTMATLGGAVDLSTLNTYSEFHQRIEVALFNIDDNSKTE